MADLSVQTYMVSLEGFNQVVVHGSCGLVDANPLRPEFFVRAPSLLGIIPLVLKGRTWRVGSRESLTGSVLRPSRSGVVVNPTRLCSYGGGSGECLLGPFSVSRSASGLSPCRELRLVFFFVYGGSVLELSPLPLSHVCSGDSSRRKRVLSGRVQAEMADLSVQTCVVSSEGFNQVVVHGSCGLVDANPSRPEFFVRAPSLLGIVPSGVINRLGVSLWSLLAVPRPSYFLMVAAVASACSVWEAFQALCDVVYKPGLLVVSSGNTSLLFVERLIDGIGYMLCGVYRRLATP
ncbi:hypothetical protein F2Q68_00045029 [Brassica cretica]|uniref:Uncharacterized protein n=1 Tax=Brassica cretica TaxID=69181 RepID=A0A8S9LKA6_BRACR|nr:hypothetical protein F2Q68_00045029 [Brassica cretica]